MQARSKMLTFVLIVKLIFWNSCNGNSMEMTYDIDIVPIINLGHLQSSNDVIRRNEELRLAESMENIGFFILTNHNMNRELMDQAWNASKMFFSSSTENKEYVPKHNETNLNGYSETELLSLSEIDSPQTDRQVLFSMDLTLCTHRCRRWFINDN